METLSYRHLAGIMEIEDDVVRYEDQDVLIDRAKASGEYYGEKVKPRSVSSFFTNLTTSSSASSQSSTRSRSSSPSSSSSSSSSSAKQTKQRISFHRPPPPAKRPSYASSRSSISSLESVPEEDDFTNSHREPLPGRFSG